MVVPYSPSMVNPLIDALSSLLPPGYTFYKVHGAVPQLVRLGMVKSTITLGCVGDVVHQLGYINDMWLEDSGGLGWLMSGCSIMGTI